MSPVWPDWAIYRNLGNFSKPLATINLPISPTFLRNSCTGVKILHFLVKSFLRKFYRHLAFFSGHTEFISLFLSLSFQEEQLKEIHNMIEMDDEGCDEKFKILFDFIQQSNDE